MAEKEISKLVKASDSAANGQVQHVLVMLNPEGTLQLHGALNFVEAIQTNEELNNNLCNTLTNVKTDEVIHAAQLLSYPKLPCSPFSAGWKGSAMIRGVLTKMLARIGYGGGGTKKRLGVGNSPLGWPENISWNEFSGATRSKLSSTQISAIIISMIEAAGLDPATHIHEPQDDMTNEEEEDEQEDENANVETGLAIQLSDKSEKYEPIEIGFT